MALSFQQGHGQFLIDQAVLGQQDPQAADVPRPRAATGSRHFRLGHRNPQGQLDGFKEFRLLDRLQQVCGDPQFFAALQSSGRSPEVSIMTTVLPTSRPA